MTATQMIPRIGAVVRVRFEDCQFECVILDAKSAWGRDRILVSPISGEGRQWVEITRVSFVRSADRPNLEPSRT